MILHSVIAALVTRFNTAVTPTAYDGPVPAAVNDPDYVLVGSTGEDGEDGATVDLELSDLGPGNWHSESGEVVCAAVSWSGGKDVDARRAVASQLAADCAASVHSDRTLGGLLDGDGLAQVSGFRYRAHQFAEGALVRVTFSVTYSHLNT